MKKILYYLILLLIIISCNNSGKTTNKGDHDNKNSESKKNDPNKPIANIKPDKPIIINTTKSDGSNVTITTYSDGSSSFIGKDKYGASIEGETKKDGTTIKRTINPITKKPVEIEIKFPNGTIQKETISENRVYKITKTADKNTQETKIYSTGVTNNKQTFFKGKEIKNRSGNVILNIETLESVKTNGKNIITLTEKDSNIILRGFDSEDPMIILKGDHKGEKKEITVNKITKFATVKYTDSKGKITINTIPFDTDKLFQMEK
ncbi:hypothetical protein F0310_04925 (plasmid) [Borrelia sp. A-FGy1]|uniref:hypothetical protein n=1 Tax=Borrelia sp. A-FGy1 TaxID=2608247 RepID=UPI0015F64C58|nr:hypothetical protein [Borrelia sp. A-FGy1]QMU99760.1 hypothetical protein F0310_04925 [Borrelia sp. A-FGy1]